MILVTAACKGGADCASAPPRWGRDKTKETHVADGRGVGFWGRHFDI
jgi:hypothetical protein